MLEAVAETPETVISVVRDDKVVPLIPSAHAPLQRAQPWRGILLERHTVPAIEIPEHAHRELCLHLQLTGSAGMEWWSDGRNRVERTTPGSMILLPPGTEDRLRWQGGSERLILSLEPRLLREIAGDEVAIAGSWSFEDRPLGQLVEEMGREAAAGWPLGGLYADLLGTSLTSLLMRRHAAAPVRLPEQVGGIPMPRLRHAMQYMTEHLDRDLRLEEIAQQVALSPFHFAREFRRSTGQTPYQYLLDQRMASARELLRHRAWTIDEVGAMTGFHSPANFVRTFRQRMGVTPGVWRKSV